MITLQTYTIDGCNVSVKFSIGEGETAPVYSLGFDLDNNSQASRLRTLLDAMARDSRIIEPRPSGQLELPLEEYRL